MRHWRKSKILGGYKITVWDGPKILLVLTSRRLRNIKEIARRVVASNWGNDLQDKFLKE